MLYLFKQFISLELYLLNKINYNYFHTKSQLRSNVTQNPVKILGYLINFYMLNPFVPKICI